MKNSIVRNERPHHINRAVYPWVFNWVHDIGNDSFTRDQDFNRHINRYVIFSKHISSPSSQPTSRKSVHVALFR